MSPPSGLAPHLDRFQRMKKGRMRILLSELKEAGTMPVTQYLGSVAVNHGIRRATAWEYIRDWVDAGYITVKDNTIYYQKLTSKEIVDKEDTCSC